MGGLYNGEGSGSVVSPLQGIDFKGDILVGTADNLVERLGIEGIPDDYVLTKRSYYPNFLGWAPPSGGGGGSGGGDLNYTHNQSSVASTWTVVHNLGKFPAVEVVDSGGTVLIPTVTFVDPNTLTVSFAGA